jgi:hypothetical protein
MVAGFALLPIIVPATAGRHLASTLLAMQAVIVATTLVAARRHGADPTRALLLARPWNGWRAYVLGLAAMVALLFILNAILIVGFAHDPLRDLRPMADAIRGDGWTWLLLAVGLGAPLSEELLIRGFLLPPLARSTLGFAAASLLTTALWTLLHIGSSLAGLVEIFAIGLLFAWLVRRTGSIRVPLLCHVLNNAGLVFAVRYAPLPL